MGLPKAAKSILSAMNTSSNIGSSGSHGLSEGQLVGSLDLLKSLFLFQVPLKTSNFLDHLVNRLEWHTQMRFLLATKIQRGPLGIFLSLVYEGPDAIIYPSP